MCTQSLTGAENVAQATIQYSLPGRKDGCPNVADRLRIHCEGRPAADVTVDRMRSASRSSISTRSSSACVATRAASVASMFRRIRSRSRFSASICMATESADWIVRPNVDGSRSRWQVGHSTRSKRPMPLVFSRCRSEAACILWSRLWKYTSLGSCLTSRPRTANANTACRRYLIWSEWAVSVLMFSSADVVLDANDADSGACPVSLPSVVIVNRTRRSRSPLAASNRSQRAINSSTIETIRSCSGAGGKGNGRRRKFPRPIRVSVIPWWWAAAYSCAVMELR